MASQSLYRKWRSQTFGELVGQEETVTTLKNARSNGTLAHAYLFTGPRGTGKTSMARLLAKTINCLNPQDGEPCNTCEQCREITAGSSFNVIEIDAASNRGIDSIRELREKVMVPPASGKYKVYILDEAHMLTVEAFNALLKTLEEPPEHAIFVMATTDVHKMLPTVISRCQRFDFKRFTIRQIVGHLRFIAEQEHVALEQGAAELMARAAAGGMRDAVSLLDQAIAYSGQEISLANVQAMLGVADPRAIQKFMTYVAALDSASGLHLIHELSEAGADLRQINAQITEYWRAMMLAKAGADIAAILDATDAEVREMNQSSKLFALEELTACARVFAQNDLVQKNQGTPQLGLELAFLTCIELHRRAQSGQPLAVPLQAASTTSSPPAPLSPPPAKTTPVAPTRVEPAIAPKVAPPEPPIAEQQVPASASLQEASPAVATDAAPYREEPLRAQPLKQTQPLSVAEETQTPVTEHLTTDAPTALTIQQVKDNWELARRRIRTRKDGAKVSAYLNGYTIVGVEGSATRPMIILKANAPFHYTALQQKSEYQEIVEWGLKVALEIPECKVRLLSPSAVVSSMYIAPPLASTLASTLQNNGYRAPTTMPGTSSTPSEPPDVEAMPEPPPAEDRVHVEPAPTHDAASVQTISAVDAMSAPPLARNSIVRENSYIQEVPHPAKVSEMRGTRSEVAHKKVTNDPVVQKVVDLFKANIKDITPK